MGQDSVPPLPRLQRGLEESAAEFGRIVTAQTIWEVYVEAWALYAQLYTDADPNELPRELPYWMTTRTHMPPNDGWSSFIFHHLFRRASPPSWNHLYFLRLYRRFKETWKAVEQYVGPFDRRFRHTIGRYIMVAFNSSQRTEIGTYQHNNSWYQGKPIFFKIQFWAPYFSPPEDNMQIPWRCVRDYSIRHPDIMPDATSKDMTVEYFHYLESAFRRLWWRVMYETDELCNDSPVYRDLVCSSVLKHILRLVGPRWHAESGLHYVFPWHLPQWEERERGKEDFFLLPISAGTVSNEYEETKHSRPTILLPTRNNVMWLLDVIESFPDLPEETLEHIEWIDKVLENDGNQFALHSHLNAKAAATVQEDQDNPLLQRFLSHTEPPQKLVRSDECIDDMDEGQDGDVLTVPDNGCDESSDESD
ncbi:hypothetical protein EDB80DRAFT_873270 [Ilyonectria destructans]|nr:hypothetical protein EDB80DRAFT_873270 [Ilyonectria destructans]